MNEIIESFQKNFCSPQNAKIYLELNEKFPFLFCLSTSDNKNFYSLLENINFVFKNEKDKENIISYFNNIDDEILKHIIEERVLFSKKNINPQDIRKDIIETIKVSLPILKFEELKDFIADLEVGSFKDRGEGLLLLEKAQKIVQKFGLKSLSFNLNKNPEVFLNDFENGLDVFCEVFSFKEKHIGLNVLNVNFKTEPFSNKGYAKIGEDGSSALIYMNDLKSFTHEWCHFLDYCIGSEYHYLSDFMDAGIIENLETNKFLHFKSILNNFQKNEDYLKKEDLKDGITSVMSEFKKFAIHKDTFEENIKKISSEFFTNIELRKDDALDIFSLEFKNILNPNFKKIYMEALLTECNFALNKIKPNITSEIMLNFEKAGFKLAKSQKLVFEDKKDEFSIKNNFIEFAKELECLTPYKNYASKTIEVLARSFEAFVHEKLTKNNKTSNLVEDSYGSVLYYPQKDIKKSLYDFWSDNISNIKEILENKEKENFNIKKMKFSNRN